MIQFNNNTLKKSAVFMGVFVAILLIVFKIFAFIKTGSLAVFSSLVDSVTDLFASMVSFVAIYFATKPATLTHRFGYGKCEALSALLQAVFVGFSGIYVVIDGIKRLINPIEITHTDVAISIISFSIFSTFLLVVFQTVVANKTNSLALKAERAHYVVDFLTNSTVIISLLFVRYLGFYYFDIIAAFFISAYLLYNAYQLAIESIEQITDKELSSDVQKEIESVVLKSEGIRGMHDFRSRNLGGIFYFEMHLEIDGNISLYKAHELSNMVEQKILDIYPNSQILIHQDPYGIKEDRLDHQLSGLFNIR